jgi:hypothetical protein
MIDFLVISNMKSRMKGDFHVRFRGNTGVKFPCVTRLHASGATVHRNNEIEN